MKLSSDQMTYAQLRKIQGGDRLILHWQINAKTTRHMEGVVTNVLPEIFIVQYSRENNPNWETAFFWNSFDNEGTAKGDYVWSFSRR